MSRGEQEPAIEPLPPGVRGMLASYRDAKAMPEAAFDRVEQRLVAVDRRRRAAIVVAAIAAAAAVIVALVTVDVLRSAVATTDAVRPQAVDVADSSTHDHDASSRAIVEPATIDPVPPGAPTPVAPQAPERRLAPRDAPERQVTAPASDDAPASTLAEERRMLADANDALAAGDHARVLAIVEAHRDRFADGLLRPELAAVRTMARCRQQPSGAATFLAELEREHPGSVLRPAVGRACGSSTK